MKMRASLAGLTAFVTVPLCFTAIVLLFAYHTGKAAPRQAVSGKSLPAAHKAAKPASANLDAQRTAAYGKLPMGFEENKGQTNSEVRFLSHGQGYELFLTSQEAVLELRRAKPADSSPRKRSLALKALRYANAKTDTSVVRIHLAGANPNPEIAGLNQLPGRTNYFMGNNPKDWRTDVPSFARVKYGQIYPGVDLVFYGNQRRLEYDYVVAPGANPSAIALDVTGARKLRIDRQGNLVMSVPQGTVELQRPVVYQEVNGQRQEIAANYAVSKNHRISFSVNDYDRSQPLIVDPILNYSTYLGGSALGDYATGIAIDATGDAFVTGQTFSLTFPVGGATIGYNTNSPDPGVSANGAVFVSELDPTGTIEKYVTYLGGTGAGEGGEYGQGIAVDTTGVYITGQTFSTNYPTIGGYIVSPLGSNPGGTAFITKLNPAVGGVPSLVYSSYVGGTNGDVGTAIAVDASENAYITGLTLSSGINTAGAFQTSLSDATDGNAFLTRIDTTQSGAPSLIYSTYLGGGGENVGTAQLGFADVGFGVAVTSGNAYIAGTTCSTTFPTTTQTANTTAAYQTAPASNLGTVFVSEIDTNSGAPAQLLYSTYLSGGGQDLGRAIALGPNNVAYVTGSTNSVSPTPFPIVPNPGAFQTTGFAAGVAFVSLIDTTKNAAASLTYSTYLGGDNGNTGLGIQADSTGNAYVAGSTDSIVTSNTFPLTPGALQTTSATAVGNAFISKISPLGNGTADLLYSTLFGGSGNGQLPDVANGIAIDGTNDAFIAGQTASTDFPVFPNPGAFQTSLTGSDPASTASAFVAKVTLAPTIVVSPASLSFGSVLVGTTSAAMTVTITNNTGIVVPYSLTNQTGNTGDFSATPGGATPCGATLAANNTPCTISVFFTPTLNGAEATNLIVGYSPYGIASSQTVALSGNGTNTAFSVLPATLTFAGQLVGTTSAPQTITITNSNNAALPFTTSLSDANDFSVAPGGASPCSPSAGVPANSSCTFSATFNPAVGDLGALVGTFLVTAEGTTQTVTLNGTGWDFSISTTTPAVTTAPGGTPNPAPSVTVSFLGGFPGPVSLSCSGSIPKGSCTVQGSVTVSGPVPVSITTNVSSSAPPISMRIPPPSRRQMVLIGFTILLLLALPFARQRRAKLGLVGSLVLLIGLTACSGSSGTPAGTYPLTITGTSGTRTQSTTITLTVT
jgi:Beta-propeller repeat